MMKVVLATGNAGKVREFSGLLTGVGLDIVPQSELGVTEAQENGLSFVENALLKARNAAQQTGLPALADDSGIVVDALGGQPGIYSARYAGPTGDSAANNAKLLSEMADIAMEQRTACFYCCIAYVRHAADPVPVLAEARWQGTILTEPRGVQGFGYDPLFFVPDYNCSAAELEPEEKNRISHRGQALQLLLHQLTSQGVVTDLEKVSHL